MEAQLTLSDEMMFRIMAKGIISTNECSRSANGDDMMPCPVRPFLPLDVINEEQTDGAIIEVLTMSDLSADTILPFIESPARATTLLAVPNAKGLEAVLRKGYSLKGYIPLMVYQESTWMYYELSSKKVREAIHNAMMWANIGEPTLLFHLRVCGIGQWAMTPIVDDDSPVYQVNKDKHDEFCGIIIQYAIFGEVMY